MEIVIAFIFVCVLGFHYFLVEKILIHKKKDFVGARNQHYYVFFALLLLLFLSVYFSSNDAMTFKLLFALFLIHEIRFSIKYRGTGKERD